MKCFAGVFVFLSFFFGGFFLFWKAMNKKEYVGEILTERVIHFVNNI